MKIKKWKRKEKIETLFDKYKCDRCGKEMFAPIGNLPAQVWVQHSFESEGYLKHFCDDCAISFDFFMEYSKRFDKLTGEIINEECGE
mgnify:CR=1 FL=1